MQLATMFKQLGFTNNWQARCPACGRTADLAELGCRREAPQSMKKRSFGWCRGCRSVRLFHIEPARPHASD